MIDKAQQSGAVAVRITYRVTDDYDVKAAGIVSNFQPFGAKTGFKVTTQRAIEQAEATLSVVRADESNIVPRVLVKHMVQGIDCSAVIQMSDFEQQSDHY